MSNSAIDKLKDYLIKNPDFVDKLMVADFDCESFFSRARTFGFDASEAEIEAYLHEKFPSQTSHDKMKFYGEDPESGVFRELSIEEVVIVGGGVVSAVASVTASIAAVVTSSSSTNTAITTATSINGPVQIAIASSSSVYSSVYSSASVYMSGSGSSFL